MTDIVRRRRLFEFGTELFGAANRSLVVLMGSSPGGSTAALIVISNAG